MVEKYFPHLRFKTCIVYWSMKICESLKQPFHALSLKPVADVNIDGIERNRAGREISGAITS
jgi:hypothetical protein